MRPHGVLCRRCRCGLCGWQCSSQTAWAFAPAGSCHSRRTARCGTRLGPVQSAPLPARPQSVPPTRAATAAGRAVALYATPRWTMEQSATVCAAAGTTSLQASRADGEEGPGGTAARQPVACAQAKCARPCVSLASCLGLAVPLHRSSVARWVTMPCAHGLPGSPASKPTPPPPGAAARRHAKLQAVSGSFQAHALFPERQTPSAPRSANRVIYRQRRQIACSIGACLRGPRVGNGWPSRSSSRAPSRVQLSLLAQTNIGAYSIEMTWRYAARRRI